MSAVSTPTRRQPATLATATRYQLNQLRYQHDPVGWIDAFVRFPKGEGLADYQRDACAALPREKRVSVRGPHGLGKTMMATLLLLWFATTRDGMDWKAVTTASVWRQLSKFLWPEIHKWVRLIDWEALGMPKPRDGRELMALSFKLETGEAFAMASNQPSSIEGAHAEHMLYVFDESKAIPDATWDAAEGAFSGGGADTGREVLALAISTPGVGPSRFRAIQEHQPGFEDWWVRRVTLEEAIAAGRISSEWAEQRKAQWGEGSVLYVTRVLGEFAEQDESGVIPIDWIYAAVERWKALDDEGKLREMPVTFISVDVADGGPDDSIIGTLSGSVVLRMEEVRQDGPGDTMKVAGRAKAIYDARHEGAPDRGVVVDSIGVGAGVVSRLREQGVQVVAFNSSAASTATDRSRELRFLNLRAEAWWLAREDFDPQYDPEVAIPDIPRLIGDLAAPQFGTTSNGRLQVESKDDVRERIGRSTDYGDVVIMGRWAQRRRPVGALKLRPAWG